jgi:hypothetical protein
MSEESHFRLSEAAKLREARKRAAREADPEAALRSKKPRSPMESPTKLARRNREMMLNRASWQQRYLYLIQNHRALAHHGHTSSNFFTVPNYDFRRQKLCNSHFHLMQIESVRDEQGTIVQYRYACLTSRCMMRAPDTCPAKVLNDASSGAIPTLGLFTLPILPRSDHTIQIVNQSTGVISTVQSIMLEDDDKSQFCNVFSCLVDGSSFSLVYERRWTGRLTCRRCKSGPVSCPHVTAVRNGWYEGEHEEVKVEDMSLEVDSDNDILYDEEQWEDKAPVSTLPIPTLYESLDKSAQPVSSHSIKIDQQKVVHNEKGASYVWKAPTMVQSEGTMVESQPTTVKPESTTVLAEERETKEGLPLFRPIICKNCNHNLNDSTVIDRHGISIERRYSVLFTLTESVRVYVESIECGKCKEPNHFDGVHDRIFNYDNCYLFSHDLLDEYTSFMRNSTMTFYAFWCTQRAKLERFGMEPFAYYCKFASAWHAYKDLQRWKYSFTCPHCGPNPRQIVLDGVTIKSPISSDWWDPFEKSRKSRKHFPLSTLLYIPNRATAKLLYSQNGKLFPRDNWKEEKNKLSKQELDTLKADLTSTHPVLVRFVTFTQKLSSFIGIDPSAQMLCRRLIRILCTSEPLLNFMPIDEAQKMCQFFDRKLPFANIDFNKMPLLKLLVEEFRMMYRQNEIESAHEPNCINISGATGPTMVANVGTMVDEPSTRKAPAFSTAPVWALMEDIARQVVLMDNHIQSWTEELRAQEVARDQQEAARAEEAARGKQASKARANAQQPSTSNLKGKKILNPTEEPFFSWFGLKRQRVAPRYDLDEGRGSRNRVSGIDNDDNCEKSAKENIRRSWGIMGFWCPHQICYGFHIIPSAEGPRDAFIPLFERFEKAPDVVVYDNACTLAKYALAREPEFFKHTRFLVDRLHGLNHSACSEACLLKSYLDAQLTALDWHDSTAESGNKTLSRIRTSCKSMSIKRFRNYVRIMLECMNQDKRARSAAG